VGTRAESNQAPVTYELPRDAVAEAIVNAVVHRDYANNASVQVMLFADRLEVWNPGELPAPLTFERLRRPHASIPHNPLICEPVFLARYAEKAGSGILDMIALCREAGLPEPEFRQDGGQFVQTMWRPKPAAAPQVTSQVAAQVGEQVTDKRNRFPEKWLGELAAAMGCPVEQVSEQVVEQVMAMLGTIREQPATKRQVLAAAGLSGAYLNYRRHLVPLLRAGLVEMTIPDSPTSRLQKYRLTEKGQGWLAGGQTGNAKP
jgi:ATP-dependent DNA helicase RecG